MEDKAIANGLAQINGLLQNVHVRGEQDIGYMLAAMQGIKGLINALLKQKNTEQPEE